jgi:hypothetical protein
MLEMASVKEFLLGEGFVIHTYDVGFAEIHATKKFDNNELINELEYRLNYNVSIFGCAVQSSESVYYDRYPLFDNWIWTMEELRIVYSIVLRRFNV